MQKGDKQPPLIHVHRKSQPLWESMGSLELALIPLGLRISPLVCREEGISISLLPNLQGEVSSESLSGHARKGRHKGNWKINGLG